jgi:glycosyltransferase involved in cell wall biosynthesis
MLDPAKAAPAISVIVPAHNAQRFLGDALASICSQSFEDFEIVVVNNGSTDATGSIIAEWASRDSRLRWFTLEKASLHRSLRMGIANSRGDFIARMDSDDIAEPQRFRRQYDRMLSHPALGLLGTAAQAINHRGRNLMLLKPRLTDAEIKRLLPIGCPFIHSSVMMRREAYLRAGGYRPGLNIAEDYDLWFRMAAVTEMANLPEPLVKYRFHKESLSARRGAALAVASMCAIAGATARRSGHPEPFVNGTPLLREALTLLGLNRRDVRLQIFRMAVARRYFTFPLPASMKKAVTACGLKPLFRLFLKGLANTRGVRFGLSSARQSL